MAKKLPQDINNSKIDKVKKLLFLMLFIANLGFAQERYPLFSTCDSISSTKAVKSCFDSELNNFLLAKFNKNELLSSYKEDLNILFEITKKGGFHVLYTDATSKEIDATVKELFSTFNPIKPATYGGVPFAKQFNYRYTKNVVKPIIKKIETVGEITITSPKNTVLETVITAKALAYNIKFSHQNYSRFDANINRIATPVFTDVKPYLFREIAPYYQNDTLKKSVETKLGDKFWNEHLLAISGDDYWFTVDPVVDFRLGKNTNSAYNKTYLNQRGIMVYGGLGKQINFYTNIRENQGRFADYINDYAYSLNPVGGYNAVIPAMGVATEFKGNAFDFPVSEGYISYTPSKFFNIQFGQGKNFIGDGYRSLFLSDVATNYPYLKIATSFWKIKYTNLYMWLRDVRPTATPEEYFRKKFAAIHNLSWQATNKLTISLFESSVFDNYQGRGFEAGYFNPIIFYKTVELGMGSLHGNGMVGLGYKYKLKDNMQFYGQFVLDEFTLKEFVKQTGYWANKWGVQFGAKYFDAFKIKGLNLQAEFNAVRPYTYSHASPLINYGHINQSLAHPWGANFEELTLIARYTKSRWFANAQLTLGQKGFDYNNTVSYGGDIYQSYDNHFQDFNNTITQGNKAMIQVASLNAGYLLNPKTNLRAFVNLTARNFTPKTATATFTKQNTLWFQVGLRTDLGNWYFDF